MWWLACNSAVNSVGCNSSRQHIPAALVGLRRDLKVSDIHHSECTWPHFGLWALTVVQVGAMIMSIVGYRMWRADEKFNNVMGEDNVWLEHKRVHRR